jgi:hypothetical protein
MHLSHTLFSGSVSYNPPVLKAESVKASFTLVKIMSESFVFQWIPKILSSQALIDASYRN